MKTRGESAVKKIDRDGLLLCEMQAETFEKSVESVETSSGIFIRRYMHSDIASLMDGGDFLQLNLQAKDIFESIEEQYGHSTYGSVKYTKNEMYWIGYIYRYYSYTYEVSSVKAYRNIKPKELKGLFLPYHTLDPAQAIERILESKNLILDEEAELQRQLAIVKRIRNL